MQGLNAPAIFQRGYTVENEVVAKSKEDILKEFPKNENNQFVYTLKEPIQYGSNEIKEFILEKPKAKHIRQMSSKPGMDDVLNVIGKIASQPNSVIDELCMEDVNILSEFFSVFG